MTARSVLFVDHATALGGAERSLLLLLRHLDREKWHPHLAGMPGPLLTRASTLGVTTHEVPLQRLRRSPRFPLDLFRGARALRKVMRESGAESIVANTVRAAIFAATATTLSGTPFIWHMRDFWLSESHPAHQRLDYLGKRALTHTTTAVVCNSSAVAKQLPGYADIRVVHNGIDVSAFSPAPLSEGFRDKYGIPKSAPLVGMIGRLRPWKGQMRFLELAHLVHERVPQCRFIVVGGDPFAVEDDYASSVVQRTKVLGLDKVVTFTGQLCDVRPPLAEMDLFVHPGDPEPFGLVNIEAMAMGRPVVAFAHGALPEIVDDGVTGLLVPPGHVHAMAQCILKLLADATLRSRMGEAARQRAVKHFSIKRTVAEIEVILRDVTEGIS